MNKNKTKTIAEILRDNRWSPYTELAKKYDTTYDYVHKIATGVRKPTRGKGLKIKEALEQYIKS